jgi:hypothetical protein
VLGWGVLLPLGALLARCDLVEARQRWPQQVDNRAWWHGHVGLQWAGIVAMSLGAALAWSQGLGAAGSPAARWHAGLGWAVCGLGWLQLVGAYSRGSKGGPGEAQLRGDHYDMTTWRRAFERLHKGLGWLALLLAPAVIVLGLVLADAPRWMLLVMLLWWLLLTAAFVRLQRRGRCIDTYQAIWGPDPVHPGNQRRPIGWGVRRPLNRT